MCGTISTILSCVELIIVLAAHARHMQALGDSPSKRESGRSYDMYYISGDRN